MKGWAYRLFEEEQAVLHVWPGWAQDRVAVSWTVHLLEPVQWTCWRRRGMAANV
jgi:hypothetical protein